MEEAYARQAAARARRFWLPVLYFGLTMVIVGCWAIFSWETVDSWQWRATMAFMCGLQFGNLIATWSD